MVLTSQTIGCLNLALSRFKIIKSQKSKADDKRKLIPMVSRGFALCDLVSKGNHIFGGIILTAYAVAIFLASFGIYFSFSVFNVYDSDMGRINELVLILSVGMVTMVAFCIYRVVQYKSVIAWAISSTFLTNAAAKVLK